jgi:hypothetical protein
MLSGIDSRPQRASHMAFDLGALGGTRTPNLLIRSQMLYPLSYERLRPTVYGTCGARSGLLAAP